MKRKKLAVAFSLIFPVLLAQQAAAGPTASLSYAGNSVDFSLGQLILGSGIASCGATTTGAIRYNSAAPGIEYCNGTSWQASGGSGSGTYDLAMFYPGTPGSSAYVRVVAVRASTYPTNLTGSSCVAKTGATASTTVTLNKIHAGSSSSVGTVVFGSGGGTNVTNCTFTAASGISLTAGDALEFVFPASPDATLSDIAITIKSN